MKGRLPITRGPTMTALLLLLVPLAAAPADPPAPTPTDEIAKWVADLSNENREKQTAAYEALMKAGPKAKSAVPALTKRLDDKNVQVGQVANILGEIGPDAKDAVPALLAALSKEGG